MLFYLFGVTGIHEQYYIFDRVKPLYYFQNPNHTLDNYFFYLQKYSMAIKIQKKCVALLK